MCRKRRAGGQCQFGAADGGHGLRPDLVRRLKLSTDPQFAAKLAEIVGRYVNPPERAVLLSVDEKEPKFRALNRAQPWLPMKKGRADTTTSVAASPPRSRRMMSSSPR